MTYRQVLRVHHIRPDDSVIHRYMDLPKFEDLMKRQALFFVRLGHLRKIEDEHEGAFSSFNYSYPEIEIENFNTNILAPGNPPETYEHTKKMYSDFNQLRQQESIVGEHAYVNCWYEGSVQSEYMWKKFGGQDGVAIFSTIGRLKGSFAKTQHDQYIHRCRYIDPKQETVSVDYFQMPLYKHRVYEQEREVRAYVMWPEDKYERKGDAGILVPVNLGALIRQIVISPRADPTVIERVEELLRVASLRYVVSSDAIYVFLH